MKNNIYSTEHRKKILSELKEIKEIQRYYSEMIFVLSYTEESVKSGKDSWKDYVYYYVYSPAKEVIELCKEVHKDTFKVVFKELPEFGYTFFYSDPIISYGVPKSDNEVFDRICSGLMDRLIVDYKIYGIDIINFYRLKIDVVEFYNTAIPVDRFKEILGKAKYKGGRENIEYLRHSTDKRIIEYKKSFEVAEKLSTIDQIKWLKHKFENEIFDIWIEGKSWLDQPKG